MLFSKENLSGRYNWNNDPKNQLFTGTPTRRLFDRWNGMQVLFIINTMAATLDSFSLDTGKKMEDLIMNHLSINPHSEVSVFNWLKQELL